MKAMKKPSSRFFRSSGETGPWVGKPLVEGAELVLHNKKFLGAARNVFGTSDVHAEFVAVNTQGLMPACNIHIDNPSFYGAPDLPRISAEAQIQLDGHGNWVILENEEVRGTYRCHAIRLSVFWKAQVRDRRSSTDNLTLDRIMAIFMADLRHRSIDFHIPADHLADLAWILLLQTTYTHPMLTPSSSPANRKLA